jgi:hypothetical protein
MRPPQIDSLLRLLPALRDLIEDFERGDQDAGLYIYVDPIWFDYLKPALEAGRAIDPAFFTWLERLAASGDVADTNFVKAGILELLGDHRDWLDRLRAQMGPTTRKLSDEVERFLGRG